jgi:hypothetical protein
LQYPDRPVKIIVAYAAGGMADILTRLMAERLDRRLGQRFIVENRPGANGAIGTQAGATAEPNGYTLTSGKCKFTRHRHQQACGPQRTDKPSDQRRQNEHEREEGSKHRSIGEAGGRLRPVGRQCQQRRRRESARQACHNNPRPSLWLHPRENEARCCGETACHDEGSIVGPQECR